MNQPQSIAEKIDARLGASGQKWKNEFVAMVGEFVGTTMFLMLTYAGAHVASLPGATVTTQSGQAFIDTSNITFKAVSSGIGLIINIWVFFRVSGSVFNPAVSLALVMVRAITPLRGLLFFIAQLVGAICAAAIVDALMPGPLGCATRLGGGVNIAQGLFIEMFLTAQLVFVIFMLAVEKHKSTFLASFGIGLTVIVAQMVGIYYTGSSLNPARTLGPDVIVGFPHYHWIYWVGPILGALVATGFYATMKVLGYDKVNGTQDRDDTIFVAKIVPHHSNASQSMKGPNGTIGGDQLSGEDFETRDIVVAPVSNSSGALSAEEGQKVTGAISV